MSLSHKDIFAISSVSSTVAQVSLKAQSEDGRTAVVQLKVECVLQSMYLQLVMIHNKERKADS